MKRIFIFTLIAFFTSCNALGQICNCESNFGWTKKTFEENDAGFKYVINIKGQQAYEDHTRRLLEKVKAAKTTSECNVLLYNWLTFFRSGHISIKGNDNLQSNIVQDSKGDQFVNPESVTIDIPKFESYIDNKKEVDFEGIWENTAYKIGIKKYENIYVGFIIESGVETWKKGQVKLKIIQEGNGIASTFYLRDHSSEKSNEIKLIGKNHLQIGRFTLSRISPKFKDEKQISDYFKFLTAQKPYIELLNKTTLYFRIPSFWIDQKRDIDSVISANRKRILSTENLIIDIRNGTGGSDASYRNILPIIYTGPIRTVGVEYLSTQLNNQRMLDFINKPEYKFDDEEKKWAKESYDKLAAQIGSFVNLDSTTVSIRKFDTVSTFPKRVGIIINEKNGSTDEQFLLAAKQSYKVKLFGTTTFGELDISNMYFIESPCKEFTLGYCLSRSMRIPGMTIDAKGIQPDYYIDKSISEYEWVEFANKVLNEKGGKGR